MRIGNFQFKPKWFPAVLTLIILVVLVKLGLWQLDRAEEKRNILASQQERLKLPIIKLKERVNDTGKLEFRRIQVRGKFDEKYQIFIDNKIHNGRPGYQVVTPLKLENSDTYVLINRGWVPMNPDRRILPDIDTTTANVTLTGLAKADPRDVADLGSANRSNPGWPAVVRFVDLNEFHKETNLKIQPFVLLLSKDQQHGFVRAWKFVILPPEKSESYAATWFTLAVVLIIIFVSVNTKKIKLNGIKS